MSSIIKVNNVQDTAAKNMLKQCGTTLTVGATGDTVTLAAGASQSGFGETYSAVNWDTASIKTTGFTGVAGTGYFCNTTSGGFTANLPAGVAGSVIAFADYANTWNASNLVVAPNGTDKIGSVSSNVTLSTNGQSVTFVYVDGVQGWINTNDSTSNIRGASFIAATSTGAQTTVTCGNFKTHIFTGPGSLCVSAIGAGPTAIIDYMVIAGGGGGGFGDGGGGGAGGFRFANSYAAPGSNSPLAAPTGIPVSITSYPITVGGGGTGGANPNGLATQGAESIFSTITSTGGGRGSGYAPAPDSTHGKPGGSGSGSSSSGTPVGTGNDPPVSPVQGTDGGLGGSGAAGGGGGAGATGTASPGPAIGGPGGVGSYIADSYVGPTAPSYGTSGPEGSTRYFSGGAGAYGDSTKGTGGSGGGGNGGSPPSYSPAPTAGTTNTGGGGGPGSPVSSGQSGGSGIVMIRYQFQS
tara:strand:+ start:821 stop:2215 length:1395 start_codon:yes stop_codon:yes gene_type:complete